MGSTFTTYELAGLLPDHHRLVLNNELNILTQVSPSGEFIAQQVLTDIECDLIEALFKSFPQYCPLEELLGVLTGKDIDRCREQLIHAQNMGGDAFDLIIRPVRNAMSRCRVKLEAFDLDAKSILLTGYMLMSLKAGVFTERERRG